MELKYISKGQMPPENKYILAYCGGKPWVDSTDSSAVYWKVVKCVYGISLKQREEYKNSNNFFKVRRSKIIEFGDEWGNNVVPYEFTEFGPSNFFGQDIDIWCELPKIK